MSDQYTRIRCGGTPLQRNANIVGLLFGPNDHTIVDADDSLLVLNNNDNETTDHHQQQKHQQTQVELHQAVFPQHNVVGWFRVADATSASSTAEPTAKDIRRMQQLEQQYQRPLLFALLQVPPESNHHSETNDDEEEEEEELPLTIYKLQPSSSSSEGSVLEALSWTLETADPERIAVECVLQQEQLQHNKGHVRHVNLQLSIQAIQERIGILQSYLQDTMDGKIPCNYNLLRATQSLLLHLGVMARASPKEASSSSSSSSSTVTKSPMVTEEWIGQLAQTIQAVQSYTDKYRVLQEQQSSSMGSLRARVAEREFRGGSGGGGGGQFPV